MSRLAGRTVGAGRLGADCGRGPQRLGDPGRAEEVDLHRVVERGVEADGRRGMDGEVAGALAPGTYRVLNLDSGSHQIVAVFRSITASKAIEVEAGNIYFFEVKVLTEWASHRMEINRLSEEEGRQAVNENKLAKII